MTCSCDIFTAPEVRAACEACEAIKRIDRQGRALADLLDGEIDPEVRAAILDATTSADVAPSRSVRVWSAGARAIIDGIRS